MTELHNLAATYAAVAETITWLAIAAALYLAGYATWAVSRLIRRIRASFTRAHQTIADIQQPREEKP